MMKRPEQQSADLKTVVIIPVLNEEKSIGKVIADLPVESYVRVIAVDNGSSDNTAQVAEQAGAMVVKEPRRGYGWACLAGMAAAAELEPDVIAFIDGDYSDFPEELSHVLMPIRQGKADFVVGSRVRGERDKGALLPQARFGNWLATRLIRLIWGFHYTDLGPFRAIRWPALQAMNMQDKTYGWTVEMQIKAVRMGLRIAEVPVRYRKRIGTSKVTGTLSGTIKAGYKILWTIFRYGVMKPEKNGVNVRTRASESAGGMEKSTA